MLVRFFGARSSPCVANFGVQKTADDNKDDFPIKVHRTVYKNFYVDNLSKSVKSIEEAKVLVKGLMELCARDGFNLTKWISVRGILGQASPMPL
jgi:hypothetical protein